MHLREGKNIEKYFAGQVEDSVKVPERQVEQASVSGMIGKIRSWLRVNLQSQMDEVRNGQKEKDPSNPTKNYFAQNLLADLDERLGNISDIGEEQRYDLRFYSAVDTILDYAGGFDCWVEIYDLQDKKVLKTVKIDITSNPEKHFAGGMAERVLYVDPKYIDPKARGKISPDFFEGTEYINLLNAVSKDILEADVIKHIAH